MKNKIFFYTLIMVCGMLVLFFAISIVVTGYNNLRYAESSVKNYTAIYADNYRKNYIDGGDLEELVDQAADIKHLRITIIDKEGTVIADSSPVNPTDNHINREEIQAALSGAPAIARRYSDTLNVEMIYYALKIDSGEAYVFVRAAIPVSSVTEYIYRALPLLIGMLIIVFLLSALFSTQISKKMLEPLSTVKESLSEISGGTYDKSTKRADYEEVNSLLVEINEISEKVNDNIKRLTRERSKLDFILNNINDGLFALDKDKNIILINEKIKQIFGISADITNKGISYLTFSNEITEAIESAISEKINSIVEFSHCNRIYLVTIKSLSRDWMDNGNQSIAVVILSDITEGRQNQKLREDFFANASHELKTPLTVIKGFNEMLSINNDNSALNMYIEQIGKETDRMINLISDMLKLSDLENFRQLSIERIELQKVARDIAESFLPITLEKNVAITINGAGSVEAESGHIYELIKNLVENAIKYNREGGYVRIDIAEDRAVTSLTVADSGIGIDAADQSRIFERFYRVEKSRSRISGGTGLGLSIVKHICALYNATINLKSKLNVGTTVTIEFNSKAKK